MIDPKELRLPNWVLSETSGEHVHMGRIDAEMGDYCNPIPLTPEILEKCGFKLSDNGNWLSPAEDSEDDLFFKMGFIMSNNNPINSFTIINNPYDGWDAPCDSLHQLQNLFYSLTGEELIYRP